MAEGINSVSPPEKPTYGTGTSSLPVDNPSTNMSLKKSLLSLFDFWQFP